MSKFADYTFDCLYNYSIYKPLVFDSYAHMARELYSSPISEEKVCNALRELCKRFKIGVKVDAVDSIAEVEEIERYNDEGTEESHKQLISAMREAEALGMPVYHHAVGKIRIKIAYDYADLHL